MKIGKWALMSGAAVIAMVGAAQAAEKKDQPQPFPLILAQNSNTPASGGISNAELAARVQALEDALSNAQERAQTDRTRLSTLEQSYNSAVWTFDNGRPSLADRKSTRLNSSH